MLAARLSRGYWFGGDLDLAGERAELALDIAEAQVYPSRSRTCTEGESGCRLQPRPLRGVTRPAPAARSESRSSTSSWRTQGTCYFLLSDGSFRRDRYTEALGYLDEAVALSRKLGDRPYEWASLAERTHPLTCSVAGTRRRRRGRVHGRADRGRWGDAEPAQTGVEIDVQRGELDEARRSSRCSSGSRHRATSGSNRLSRRTHVPRRAEGRLQEALADGEAAIETAARSALVPDREARLRRGARSGLRSGGRGEGRGATGLHRVHSPGSRSPYLDAQARRFRARLAGGEGAAYAPILERFRALGVPFWVAVTLLEQGDAAGTRRGAGDLRAARCDAVARASRSR